MTVSQGRGWRGMRLTSFTCVFATRSLVSSPLAEMMSEVVVITLRNEGNDAGPLPPPSLPAPAPAKISNQGSRV